MTASAQNPIVLSSPTPGAPAQPPPRDPQQAQAGTARIRGRVFAADSGLPIRKAMVRIFAPALREQRMATTDGEGRYEFVDLPAGRYNVTASKGSYVMLSYGQQRPFEPGRPLEVADAQTLEKVDFSLPRGGIVTGRVFDEYGDPVADARVMAMRYAFQQGRRQLVPSGRSGTTNDIGEFRLFGLPPGQYYISATLQTMGFGASEDRSGYAPTYFPGTSSVGEAQKVPVAVAQTVTGINIPLLVTRTSKITGTVVDSDGKPVATGAVQAIQRTGGMFMFSMGGQIKPDGSFTLSNVAPGEYTLMANIAAGPGDMSQVATATVTVSGDDVEGVRLAALRPAVATGKIVLDGTIGNATIQARQFQVNARPVSPEMMIGPVGGGGPVKDDFTFEMRVRPCACVIRANGPGGDWFVKAIRYGGEDITDSGMEFRADQEISGLEVELTNHPAVLSGVVNDEKGQPSRDYTLILFARDRERWNPGTRYVMTGRPDQDGRYKIRGVPAGDYYAIAVDYVEQGQWTDPEYLDQLRANATSVMVGDGETKTLDLKRVSGT